MLHRGLAPDREDRYPTSPRSSPRWTTALGRRSTGRRSPRPWLPLDPDLTQPGPRPVAAAGDGGAAASRRAPRRRRGRRCSALGAGLPALGPGARLAGTSSSRRWRSPRTRRSPTTRRPERHGPARLGRGGRRRLAAAQRARAGTYAALSVGESADWPTDDSARRRLRRDPARRRAAAEQVPQHPECEHGRRPVAGQRRRRPVDDRTSRRCPGGVTVERVVQVAGNRLLWVQVRSADRATANRVLESGRDPRAVAGRRSSAGACRAGPGEAIDVVVARRSVRPRSVERTPDATTARPCCSRRRTSVPSQPGARRDVGGEGVVGPADRTSTSSSEAPRGPRSARPSRPASSGPVHDLDPHPVGLRPGGGKKSARPPRSVRTQPSDGENSVEPRSRIVPVGPSVGMLRLQRRDVGVRRTLSPARRVPTATRRAAGAAR